MKGHVADVATPPCVDELVRRLLDLPPIKVVSTARKADRRPNTRRGCRPQHPWARSCLAVG